MTGGDSAARNSYLFVVFSSLLQKNGSASVTIHYDCQEILPAGILIPGIYVAQVQVGQDAFEAPGPHAKTTKHKPFPETASSTVSDSARSSVGQNQFILQLLQRDQTCLVTGTYCSDVLSSCHIVPYSLGRDFVRTVSDGLCGLYSPANGLLLVFDSYSLR